MVMPHIVHLPGDLPARVLALARDLTATSATPYDRALAIESYLRTIPYNLDIAGPPPGQDVVDYFLCDLKQGYCDYFATSMVVLARAAGLPARLVVGYASGAALRTEGTFRYTVTEAEAHSWVEIYVPELGWIEFEPTSGRAATERSELAAETVEPETHILELAERSPLGIRISGPIWGILLAPLIAWIGWVLIVDPLRLKRRPPQHALRVLYLRLRSHAHDLQIDSFPGDTPFELQKAFDQSPIRHLGNQTRDLIAAYVHASYTREPIDDRISSTQIGSWRKLSVGCGWSEPNGRWAYLDIGGWKAVKLRGKLTNCQKVPMTEGALDSVRVVDFSRVLAGPYCTMMLGDLGADVIKVEQPGSGDSARQWGPPWVGEESAYFLSANRNKRSVTLNLKHPEGQRIAHALIASADVIVENFRSGTTEKLGLDYDSVSSETPSVIYCSITGYGQNGPYRERSGYDFMIQAQGGLMSITGPEEGPPFKVGVAIVDITAGLHAASAILAALFHRKETGQGQHIDIALLDAQVG